MIQHIRKFLQLESASGILLLTFAMFAMLFANTPLKDLYFDFLSMPVSIQIGLFSIYKPLLMWVNDGFMAVFFVLIGLEVKREMMVGAISNYQRAIFPAIGALGGMIVPALVFTLINNDSPEFQQGWAIPMATDIAFALGVLGLLGKRVPFALKIFLLALAIIDDLGAIVVIAIFFSHELSTTALISAAIAIAVLIIMNRMRVTAICAYMVVGLILWASVLKSGVHATLAGVIIGFCVPLKGKNGEEPLAHFEHLLAPWCSFVILPLFAFSNAGVSLAGMSLSTLFSPLTMGVALGLLVGKTLGVFSFSFLAVKLGIAQLSEGINFKQIFAVSVLCGIGFTMSMFLAGLAFGGDEADGQFISLARLGILIGSGISAVLGYYLLKLCTMPNIHINNLSK
ncbi:Na+/H+ antiporter NhaA [Glaesserella parasuis]|uniref:Na(+)/H(+) antiporter NhaA n=2 Tax=Glaesserella parasuis TaxID=738 RepID=NHAA_GLAP5|nr:Na+/H+ antiporter NhaA [Glaesserella parasuis]B8F7T0.1 RecName: Full=Na(+)/H(+) antiporter NhaA; AltName: Full=Sodium/proton antiporter NhaA [Glaesserella parasuis SH0165]ACL33382.1 Na+/H+ antiporter NhaA [Glaesserella parasuis SH0165]EMY45430.1 pH-dependent sodium/proton antiporter [Glaesserella parasuis gx033]MDG6239278.1 Na+/H+ antiporter NhaA [Glaesserella parasuis]MDG6247714.1 Na+/H+ antiporter NhaA [Glaesserella parasuis]MDG6282178.1 Na+/H+ antiporter NhaA [Glaesserella parasuis]